jgi:hypothetical protein
MIWYTLWSERFKKNSSDFQDKHDELIVTSRVKPFFEYYQNLRYFKKRNVDFFGE